MGQEISGLHFSTEEYTQYQQRLQAETDLLEKQLHTGKFSTQSPVGGFEIEGWLIDQQGRPAPENEHFLSCFNNPLATAELAKFNIELNNTPLKLNSEVFARFEHELHQVFSAADRTADQLDLRVLLIGILPTAELSDFCVQNMSEMKRYHALNTEILKARHGRPLQLDIKGREHLSTEHDSVMLEAATTSFQVHMQVPWQHAHHYYNASILASAASMAVSVNSPYLFGQQLWQETRIPLFEQSVDAGTGLKRVSFGTGFAVNSIAECFRENIESYPVLLPVLFDKEAARFAHLCLHNGVIWRWNRPLIGFDANGTPHIRIEHRVMPAGPTIKDMVANAVFFYGLTQTLAEELMSQDRKNVTPSGSEKAPILSFKQARHNFYQAAQHGLQADITWQQGKRGSIQACILQTLLAKAEQGLQALGIAQAEITEYLAIIRRRTETGMTGAQWQQQCVEKKGMDMYRLQQEYLHHQHEGKPVHTWTV